ncbi:hypothetical protein ACFL2T_05665 [Elusimicrobiota bacterium]
MLFVKRTLPLVVCFTVGMLIIIQYYVPHGASLKFLDGMNAWLMVIAFFAWFLGFSSVMSMHLHKLRRLQPGWGFSILVFLGFLIGVGTGFISHGKQLTEEGVITSFGWMYNNLLNPLQATMFCILGFYVVSASYRAFRVKSAEAGVLLVAAAIFIAFRVPLGQYMWEKSVGGMFPWQLHQMVEWIMNTPAKAAARGILIGVSLGMIATSLKILLGIERAWLGGKD